VLAAGVNLVPGLSERVDGRLVIRADEGEVAGRRRGLGFWHQMDLLGRCSALQPHRAANDSRRRLNLLKAEDCVKSEAFLKGGGWDFTGYVMDHFGGFPRQDGRFGPFGSRDSCKFRTWGVQNAAKHALDWQEWAFHGVAGPKVPSAGRVSFEHSYHLEGGSK